MLDLATNQITFFDLDHDIDDLTSGQSFAIFELFDEFVHLENLIPFSFYKAYYSRNGRNHDFPLEGMLKAIIIAQLIGIPSTNLLILFIQISSEFRRFLHFPRAPHKSQFSRFKTTYHHEINLLFHNLVDFTDAYAHTANEFLADILITDTTGFEYYVRENNPKFFQNILSTAKNYAKTLPNDTTFNIEKYAQGKMPKASAVNPDAKSTFLNGHFGYYRKGVITTNGFGLIRDINFIDSKNELINDLTPSQIKDLYDAKSLIPTLETYFHLHPNHHYNYFLGDAGFDADNNYAYLYNDKNIIPIIPINPRNKSTLPEPGFNDIGTPTCPNNPDLPMVFAGFIKSKGRADRSQFICPKRTRNMILGKSFAILDCDNPCTSSQYGRTKNLTINHNYRYLAAMPRDSQPWIDLYKQRTVCERTINQLKDFINIKTSKIRNTTTLQSNIILAGISQLIAFIILFHSKYATGHLAIRSLIS